MENKQPANPSDEPQPNYSAPAKPPDSTADNSAVTQPQAHNLADPGAIPAAPVQEHTDSVSPAQTTFNPTAIHPTVSQNHQQLDNNGGIAAPASIAPTNSTFLMGSQVQQAKKRLPKGVYVIVVFTLLGFVTGFFDASQTSAIYVVAMFVNLLLAVGLVLRLEVARKLMVWLSILLAILMVVSVLLFFGLQQRIHQLNTNYETAVSRIDPSSLTPTQKQQLEVMSTTLAKEEKRVGRAISFTYLKLGVTALEAVAVIVYLTRPKIKEVFHELEA